MWLNFEKDNYQLGNLYYSEFFIHLVIGLLVSLGLFIKGLYQPM